MLSAPSSELTVIKSSIDEKAKRTASLLFSSDDQPGRPASGSSITISITLAGNSLKAVILPPSEPSTIYTKLPIQRPSPTRLVPPPGYYPTYVGLFPEQKWIYLNWLKDVSQPIEIGYVFLYYYGLERQLLIGNFDEAFHEIMLLRKHHNNQSFHHYSGAALLQSCIHRKRLDMLEYLDQSEQLRDHGNLKLLVSHYLGFDLAATSLMDISRAILTINQRYIKNEPALFELTLTNQLNEKYGTPYFPFAGRYDIDAIPKTPELLFANISFPEDIRSPRLPNFLEFEPFLTEVKEIFTTVHEIVKLKIKQDRKSKK